MPVIYVLIVAYLLGCFVSYWMMKTEHLAGKEKYTKGQMVLGVMFSILSWLMVVVLLTRSWFINIGRTGYWEKPVKEEKDPIVVEVNNTK